MKRIDARTLGLSSRTVIEKNGENLFILVKLRKSRIIMKDAQKIADEAATILKTNTNAEIKLRCYSNICSKSIAYLKERGIEIVLEE